MSRYFLFAGLLSILLRLPVSAFTFEHDTLICLKVMGKFENAFDKNRKPCMVEVIRNGVIVDTVHVTWLRKKFTYLFECGKEYTLRISKDGFAPMVLMVDTKEMQDMETLHLFEFETRLITEKRAKTFNRELLTLPMAVISYDTKRKKFRYDEAYTEYMKLRTVVNNRKW